MKEGGARVEETSLTRQGGGKVRPQNSENARSKLLPL